MFYRPTDAIAAYTIFISKCSYIRINNKYQIDSVTISSLLKKLNQAELLLLKISYQYIWLLNGKGEDTVNQIYISYQLFQNNKKCKLLI